MRILRDAPVCRNNPTQRFGQDLPLPSGSRDNQDFNNIVLALLVGKKGR